MGRGLVVLLRPCCFVVEASFVRVRVCNEKDEAVFPSYFDLAPCAGARKEKNSWRRRGGGHSSAQGLLHRVGSALMAIKQERGGFSPPDLTRA